MSDNNAPASQRQQLVAVSGWGRYFSTKSGGEVSADTSPVWDGGNLKPSVLAGPATTANIVVSRPYRPGLDAAVVKAWEKVVGRKRTTIWVRDTDPDLGPIGTPTVYADALLVRVTRPDHDAASSDPGMIELEFAVSGAA